ncbi:MAG: hypothetical protein QNK37_11935 [Acidobacteriota bacterium]|nr:hypothetical protein [Acidobacteriota bacterium]
MKSAFMFFLLLASTLTLFAKEVTAEAATALNVDTCQVRTLDADRSLVVTDQEVLDRFPLRTVLQTLINRANVAGTNTPDTLWSQWWSALRPRQIGDPANEPHCDDNGTTINGYTIQCPRAESSLENAAPESHVPVAVFNRFDLAPMDGSNCGEYRIVYTKSPFSTFDRNLIIFEGVLPNPDPDAGACGCLPVAEFWGDLTFENNVNVRADMIEDFFFNGLQGFEPIIRPEAYGLGGTSGYGSPGVTTGQIRTNMFMQQPWTLREFQLERKCTSIVAEEVTATAETRAAVQQTAEPVARNTCKLIVAPRPVGNNPHPSEWTANPLTPTTYQTEFVNFLQTLIPSDDGINNIVLTHQPDFNAGESNSQADNLVPSTNFAAQIDARLNTLGVDHIFSPTQIGNRATTQTCAGCHMQSDEADLGNMLDWPDKNPIFVHVDENSALSNALTMAGGFLDHRLDILEEFLGFSCNSSNQCPTIARNLAGALTNTTVEKAAKKESLGGSVTH